MAGRSARPVQMKGMCGLGSGPAAKGQVDLDQINCPRTELIAIRVFYPHVQQSDEKQMGIHCQMGGILREMELLLYLCPLRDLPEFFDDPSAV